MRERSDFIKPNSLYILNIIGICFMAKYRTFQTFKHMYTPIFQPPIYIHPCPSHTKSRCIFLRYGHTHALQTHTHTHSHNTQNTQTCLTSVYFPLRRKLLLFIRREAKTENQQPTAENQKKEHGNFFSPDAMESGRQRIKSAVVS